MAYSNGDGANAGFDSTGSGSGSGTVLSAGTDTHGDGKGAGEEDGNSGDTHGWGNRADPITTSPFTQEGLDGFGYGNAKYGWGAGTHPTLVRDSFG